MMIKRNFVAILTALAATTLLAAGCGGDVECGKDTVEKDGKCVAKAGTGTNNGGEDILCGAGTTLTDGVCVLDNSGCGAGTVLENGACVAVGGEDTCGEGTTLDSVTGKCVANSNIECGDGTVAVGNTCEPLIDSCEAGTQLEDGKCILDPTVCGTGTELDANTGLCTTAAEACAEGLALTDGKCVPTAEVCDAGTHFIEEAGLCLPDETCKSGDQVVDGICLSPAAALYADPTAVSIDGEEASLVLPALGEDKAIFKGIVNTPTELDEDGNYINEVDTFTFEGEAGQYIKLTLQALESIDLVFEVTGPETTEYIRTSSVGVDVVPVRYVYIPYDGEYTVTVQPALNWFWSDIFIATGGEGFEFAGTVEQVEVTAKDLELSKETVAQVSGNSRNLPENLYNLVNVAENDLVSFTINEFGIDAASSILVLDTTATPPAVIAEHTDLGKGETFTLIGTGNDLQILVDNNVIAGLNVDFEIDAIISGKAQEIVVGPGETIDIPGNASPNSFIKFTVDTDSTSDFTVTGKDSADAPLNSDVFNSHFFYAAGGDYTLTLLNEGTEAIAGLFITELVTPIDLGGLAAGETILDIPRNYPNSDSFGNFIFSAALNQIIEVRQVHDKEYTTQTQVDNDRMVLDVWNEDNENPIPGNYFNPRYINASVFPSEAGGTTALLVQNLYLDAPARDFQIQIASKPIRTINTTGFDLGSTLNEVTATAIGEFENEYLAVTINEDVFAHGTLSTNNDNGETTLIIYDSEFTVVDVFQTVGTDTISGLKLETGDYIFRILSNAASPDGYTLNLEFTDSTFSTEIVFIDVPDFMTTLSGTASDGESDGTHIYYNLPNVTAPTYVGIDAATLSGAGWMYYRLYEDGEIILESYLSLDGPGNPPPTTSEVALFEPGKDYRIRVGGGQNPPFNDDFTFEISFDDTVTPPPPTQASTGINNSFATADVVTESIPVILSGSSDEEDPTGFEYWKISVDTDTDVVLTGTALPSYMEISYRIFAADQTTVLLDTGMAAGDTQIRNFTFTANETYYIVIGGNGQYGPYPYDYTLAIEEI